MIRRVQIKSPQTYEPVARHIPTEVVIPHPAPTQDPVLPTHTYPRALSSRHDSGQLLRCIIFLSNIQYAQWSHS